MNIKSIGNKYTFFHNVM